MAEYRFFLNGIERSFEAPAGLSLLDLLRDQAGLTGAKLGCGEGQCGACAVLLNGRAVKSCVTPAASARGAKVITIEGLAQGDALHPVQRAFLEKSALQCGFCTPGMIIGAAGLLAATPNPSHQQIVDALNGHICRCGAYPRIVEAVLFASRLREGTARG